VNVRSVFRWLANVVKEHTPQQFKFTFGLWTLSLIAVLIEREFGKKLSLALVSRIMKGKHSVQRKLSFTSS